MAPRISHSARLYQERMLPCQRNTRRLPGPRHDVTMSEVHRLPLALPYPSVEVLNAECHKPPDSGLTSPWPHGAEETL